MDDATYEVPLVICADALRVLYLKVTDADRMINGMKIELQKHVDVVRNTGWKRFER